MSQEQSFFEYAATVGLTKHIGGVDSTEELAELCQIGDGKYILDVGCGVGVTPCFLAKKYHCRVMGVDISPKMIEQATRRARKEKLADQVEFKVADAQDLPFDDNLFDAVITESVTAFPEDKQKAVIEYARVTKPGGFVGLNESTWLKVPPPPEIVAWAKQDIGASVSPQTTERWRELLINAGVEVIEARIKTINTQDESKAIVQRYGVGGMIGVMFRMLWLYIRNPHYRRFVKGVSETGVVPDSLNEYFGYGIFVGKN